MSDWTPSTEQVRDGYAIDPEAEYRNPIDAPAWERENRRAFDRWLAQHDVDVLNREADYIRDLEQRIERVRAEERERCLKAVERQAEMAGRDINISQYREGLNDGVWRAVSAIDRLPAIRAVPEQEDRPRKFSEMRAYPGMNGIPERRTDA